ncbi:MAG TPA: hypothetical protein VN429_11025 [Methanospirillum sp.]|uniref:hypothetical protein n=1 Tax=Methanospirillum sp. TaxID=45200 RepID=UPI002BC825D7|nr:hypothetical protein [Methanospirillum sp.]HWQ64939.1 hypothetical protein [Methanospirillum sp.]
MSINKLPLKNLYAWTIVLTAVTMIGGILSIISGIGIEITIPVAPDIPGGIILLLLGLLLATGLYEGMHDHTRWVQFGYTGIILILIFGVCTVIISGANLLSLMLEGEETDPVSILYSGYVWAAILALPIYPGLKTLLFGCSQDGAFS